MTAPNFYLELMFVDQADVKSLKTRRVVDSISSIQQEDFLMKGAQKFRHRMMLDQPAFIDDGHVPAKVFGLFEVMGRQYDRRTG